MQEVGVAEAGMLAADRAGTQLGGVAGMEADAVDFVGVAGQLDDG